MPHATCPILHLIDGSLIIFRLWSILMLAHYVIIYLAGEIESIYQAANKWMVRRIRIGIWISIHSISISDSWMGGWVDGRMAGWHDGRIAEGAKLLNNFSNLKLITIFFSFHFAFCVAFAVAFNFSFICHWTMARQFRWRRKGRRHQHQHQQQQEQ